MQQETRIENPCYFAEKNMKIFALNMVVFGCETFAQAKHIKEIEKLSSQIDLQDKYAKEGKRLSQEIIEQMSEFVLDTIPDWVRITICFENYMKAILLKNGFLIHKIDKNGIGLKTLANSQNRRPVRLSKFREVRNFSMDINTKQWIVEGLKPQTLDFSLLLRKKFQDEIQLPEKILKQVSEINSKRNNLHFYHEATNSYSQHFIEDLKQLDKFVKEDMMNLVSSLEIELNLKK